MLGLKALLLIVSLARHLVVAPERRGRSKPLSLSGLGEGACDAAAKAAVRLTEADRLAAQGL